jgi:hypothetical protein
METTGQRATTLNLTEGMVQFIAEMLISGLTWTAIGAEFGVTGQRIKAAYLRGSRKFYA